MKQMLVVVLLVLPLSVSATPVDSMFGPFKLPFQIGTTVHGRFRWNAGAGEFPMPQNFGQTFTVDFLGMQTHVHAMDSAGRHGVDTIRAFRIGDTLRYQYASYDTTPGSSELLISNSTRGFDIYYDSAQRLIPWIHLWSNSNSWGDRDGTYDYIKWSVNLSDFQFDRDSIVAASSDISKHLDTAIYNDVGKTQHDPLYQYSVWLDTVSSVDLSGIFSTSHLSYASVAPSVPDAIFTVREMDGLLICNFSSTAQERTLEIYSPIGILLTRAEIQPDAASASFALPAGFYFLRLDGIVKKVYVAE